MSSFDFRTVCRKVLVPSGKELSFKAVQLSDLHNFPAPEAVAEAVADLAPEALFITGDMIDRRTKDGSQFITLLSKLSELCPELLRRTYACLGNHELSIRRTDPDIYEAFIKATSELGVCWLDNRYIRVDICGKPVDICGLTADSRQRLSRSYLHENLPSSESGGDVPKIILTHDPRWFDVLADQVDALVLAGHIHGGIWRLPLCGGLLSPEGRFFPHFDKGVFYDKKSCLNLSAGFGNSVLKRRIFNPRELDLLEIKSAPNGGTRIPFKNRPIMAVITLLVLALFLLNINEVLFGFRHLGGMVLSLLLFLALLRIVFRKQFALIKSTRLRPFYEIFRIGVLAFCAAYAVISVMMLGAILNKPPERATAVVLGCALHGETPSMMLRLRLEAAERYLKENPEADCVVSGAMGPGESITEAEAMRRFLTAHGIDESRIYIEDNSFSTKENIENSLKIIEENGLNNKLAIVTDCSHELRAQFIAWRSGADIGGVPAEIPWWLFTGYWTREVLGNGNEFLTAVFK